MMPPTPLVNLFTHTPNYHHSVRTALSSVREETSRRSSVVPVNISGAVSFDTLINTGCPIASQGFLSVFDSFISNESLPQWEAMYKQMVMEYYQSGKFWLPGTFHVHFVDLIVLSSLVFRSCNEFSGGQWTVGWG
jgi:hypothetical protein